MLLQRGGFPAVYLSAVSDRFSTILRTVWCSFDCCSLYLHILCTLMYLIKLCHILSARNCLV